MRSKDMPCTQVVSNSCPPVHAQNQQRHCGWLLPGWTKHGVVAGEKIWAVEWEGIWRGPGEAIWLTHTSGHPGRGLSLCQQYRQRPLCGPGRDWCCKRLGCGWI